MKKQASQPIHVGHALSGAAGLFRDIADRQGSKPDLTQGRDQRCPSDRATRESLSQELGKYLSNTLSAYGEFDRDIAILTDGRGSLASLGAALLEHGEASKTRSQQSVSGLLDLLAGVFETTNQQYKLAQGLAPVIVPLLGRASGNVIEVKQFVPTKVLGGTGGKWLVCPATLSPPHIHQVLTFVTEPGQPVQIRMRWQGMQPVQVYARSTTDVRWEAAAWIDAALGPLGTVFLSPVLWPRYGRITTTMGIVVSPGTSTELASNYEIVIDLQEDHSESPVDRLPPEDIVIPDPDPTPDSHPLDILSRFDPDQLRRLHDLTIDFVDDRMRAFDALTAAIGVAAVADSGVLRAALLHVNPAFKTSSSR